MSDLIVLGTDTGAGKTTFCLLWMAAFGERYEYWKPVETGESDTEWIRRMLPSARVHPPLARYHDAVAPALAARREGSCVPDATEIAGAMPRVLTPGRHLLIETFGSPLSPLGDDELQVAAIRQFSLPTILVGSSAVGAVGRTLQSLIALAAHQIRPTAVVLLGPYDQYAVEQIQLRRPLQLQEHVVPVFSLDRPESFDFAGIARSASVQRVTLKAIRTLLSHPSAPLTPTLSPRRGGRGQGEGGTGSGRANSNRSEEAANCLPANLLLSTCHSHADAASLIERDRRLLWHPYTSLQEPDDPLLVVGAEDEFLVLANGQRVIDGISSWWTILHGHRHPVLMKALAEAAQSYDHVHFAGVTHAPAVELAELMLSTMPWTGGRVFFSDDGSTAVEVALKMAYQYWCHQGEPQRTRFVSFEGGYHGDTFGAMAVGRDAVFFGRFEPLLFKVEQVPISAERLDDLLGRSGGQVAAVIIEPLVQGAGGMRMHTPAELRSICQVAQEHGVLFIADEVMTGGGRTGDLWAHQTAGIAPDLVCAGKTIAGGLLPLAATLAAPHVVAAFDTSDRSGTFFHGHSFTAHPLACAVGAANWRMLTNGVGAAPAMMERFWAQRLTPLGDRPGIKQVRIRGTIAAIEIDCPGGYLARVGGQMRRAGLERCVLLRPLGNVLYTMPPLCTSSGSLDQIAQTLEQVAGSVGSDESVSS